VLRHDIKNDMTVIKGRANVITEADPEAELVTESAQIIDRQVGKVLNVIDSTSAISAAISEDPDFEAVDLAAVVEEVVDHSQDSLPGTVTADVPDSAPVLANDAVRTVVSNLIENAIEHNDTDEPSVHVTVEPEAETVRLCVHDNGPGIPDERKRTVFEPRPDDTGRGGLNVVSTLVESYGGEIRIQDNQPRGSVFVVTFPRP
jgi:signal transduction histidine kinase